MGRRRVLPGNGWVLTDFEVEYMVGADSFAAVLEELLDMDGDWQALQLAALLSTHVLRL